MAGCGWGLVGWGGGGGRLADFYSKYSKDFRWGGGRYNFWYFRNRNLVLLNLLYSDLKKERKRGIIEEGLRQKIMQRSSLQFGGGGRIYSIPCHTRCFAQDD